MTLRVRQLLFRSELEGSMSQLAKALLLAKYRQISKVTTPKN